MKSIKSFEKHQVSNLNKSNGGGIGTTYNTGTTLTCYKDTWYLFEGNQKSTVDEEGNAVGNTDYTLKSTRC